MNILLTGGSGFIGKNLKEYLEKKYTVFAPTHQELELTNKEKIAEFSKKNKIKIVIHAAGVGGHRKNRDENILENNLKMFFSIADNPVKFEKIIFLGSGAEYDKSKNIINAKEFEFGKNIPDDDYGFSKYICSKYIEKSNNIINLRLFGVFGKYEDCETRFISNIICRVLFDLPVQINQNMLLDYIFIEDLCKIVEYFIQNPPLYKFYNVGNGEHVDLFTIAEKIKEISWKNIEIEIKNPGMNNQYTCDNSLLKEELKNFKFTKIDEAIKKLYTWYFENKDKIKNKNFLID